MNVIKAEGLTKSFGHKLVLRGVSFEVREGEVLGLLGPNGAGKTTTVRIIIGVLRPDSGSATVLDHDVLKEPLEVRRLTGYLPEIPCLYEGLTVEENLLFYGRLYDVPEDELEERVSELLDLLGLKERAGEKVGALSKGLKQRVALIRALVHDPPILVLDQPTSDLDPASARGMREHIKELKEAGKTILICTHNLTEAEELCDRVAIINEGRILAIGKPDELLPSPEERYFSFEISSLSPAADYVNVLKGLDEVLEVREAHGNKIVVVLDEKEAISDVVRELVLKGCRILEVRMVRPSLEEVYLKLVRGP